MGSDLLPGNVRSYDFCKFSHKLGPVPKNTTRRSTISMFSVLQLQSQLSTANRRATVAKNTVKLMDAVKFAQSEAKAKHVFPELRKVLTPLRKFHCLQLELPCI